MDIGTILTVSIGALLIISTLFGLIRGRRKAFFRFFTVTLSAVGAFVGVIVLKNMLGTELITSKVNAFLAQIGLQKVLDVAASSPLLEEVILKTAGGIIAPLLFLVAFLVLSILTYVIYLLYTLLFRRSLKKTKKGFFGGIFAMIFGFGQGVVITAALVLTVISYTSIVPEIAPKLESSESFNESVRASITGASNTIEQANNSQVITVYKTYGLDLASHLLMDFEIKIDNEAHKIGMNDEIASISELVFTFMDLSATPMAEYGESEAALIQKLGTTFTKSRVLSLAGTELLHSATESWKNGETFAGIAKPTLGADMEPLLTKVISIFNESTNSTVTFKEDVITVSNLISVFAKNGLFAATSNTEDPNALFNCIAKDGVISEITLTLNTSTRMNALIPEITNLGLKTLASTLGIAENTTVVYNDALKNIAEHIMATANEPDPVKRAEALMPLVEKEFKNIGVTIEPEHIEILASALIEDFGDFDGTITPEFIAEFFDIYNNTLADGDGSEVQTLGGKPQIIPLDNNKDNNKDKNKDKNYTFPKYAEQSTLHVTTGAANAAKSSKELIETIEATDPEKAETLKASSTIISDMRSSETATINRTTLEDFLVDSDTVITDPVAESLALESIVKEVVVVIDALNNPENNGVEVIKELSESLGGALDALSGTEMYGSDKTITLFSAILESDTIRETTQMTVSETKSLTEKQRENSEEVTFGELMGVVSSTVDVITSMQNSEVTTDSIEELIKNITPGSAEIIKELITVQRMESMGIPANSSATSADLLKKLFENLGKITDPEAFNLEAKAVQNLVNIGVAAKDNVLGGNNTSSFLFAVPGTEDKGMIGCTADELVANVMSSTAVCDTLYYSIKLIGANDPFGIAGTMAAEDIAAIKNACDSYVMQNLDKTPEELDTIIDTLDSINKLLAITDWTAPTL